MIDLSGPTENGSPMAARTRSRLIPPTERSSSTRSLQLPISSGSTANELAKTAAPSLSKLNSPTRSEEHTSELQSLMRITYAVLCLHKTYNNQYTALVHTPHYNIKHKPV